MKSGEKIQMNFKKNQGFTLLELMIVIALIGIIFLVSFPNLRGLLEDQTLFSEARKVKSDLRYMQQIAFDTQNTCTITYGTNSYTIKLNSKTIKSEKLENNVKFQSPGTFDIGGDGIPTHPDTITLIKNDSKVDVQILSGGKIEIR